MPILISLHFKRKASLDEIENLSLFVGMSVQNDEICVAFSGAACNSAVPNRHKYQKGLALIMKYDFTSIMDRKGKDAVALDVIRIEGAEIKEGFSKIPMWVADMNFQTVPSIPKAIIERVTHPAYGYFNASGAYYDAIIDWHTQMKGVTGLTKDSIGYENGVLGGVISALGILCSKGDNVLLHSPVYIGFTNSLENNGYNSIHSPLKLDENGVWRMDFEDMERKIKKNKIHAAIFCSPHNPCGRVWERWELERAMEIYRENDVYVISDEIWSDILLDGHQHIPTQSVSEDAKMRTIALYAPSKTFNLAGLVGSYHVVYNRYLRERMEKESSLSHYNEMNVLSMHALTGAYGAEGREWVSELRETLSGNIDYACNLIAAQFDGVSVSKPEGTYMLLLNCTEWCAKHGKTIDDLLKAGVEVGVIWQDGREFFAPCSIRMNLALPLSLVKEAFDRLAQYVFHA